MGRKLRISEGALTSKRYLEALKDAVEDHKEVMNIVQISNFEISRTIFRSCLRLKLL